MNIAHFFTFLRLAVIPFFPIIYLGSGWLGISNILMPYLLLTILLFCEATDLVDGFLARRHNLVSDAGKILDPMADSIVHILVFFTFTQGLIQIPLLLVFVFVYREFFISTLRTICALKGYALAARKSGKFKTVLQATINFLIVILLIPYAFGKISLPVLQNISTIAVSLAAIYTIFSAIDYIYSNREYIRKAFS